MEQPQIIEAELKLKHYKRFRKQIKTLTTDVDELNAKLEKTVRLMQQVNGFWKEEEDKLWKEK